MKCVGLHTSPAFSVFTSSIIQSWVSPRLTGAMVPPKFHLFILMPGLHFGSSHRGRGLGSVRSFSGTKTSLTNRLELHCPGEGFFWPSLSLDWTSTRTEDSNDFDDLRLQKLARVFFVSLVGRRPDLKQGKLPSPESVPSNWLTSSGATSAFYSGSSSSDARTRKASQR